MTKTELEKMAEKYQSKADSCFDTYQETGMPRYANAYRKNDDLAAALRMAAAASEEHHAYIAMKAQMANFASRASLIQLRPEEAEELTCALIRDMIAYGQMLGLIGGK